MSDTVVLWWLRRDLRLTDNVALQHALRNADIVIPIFIFDPKLLNSPFHHDAYTRQAFLFAGLHALAHDLRQLGSRLIVRTGIPLEVLSQLVRETGSAAIFAEEDYSPYARQRDLAIARTLPLKLVSGVTVFHPRQVLKADGNPYTVFTPFSKTWKSLSQPIKADVLPSPATLKPPPSELMSEALPQVTAPTLFPAGEQEARRRLEQFTVGERAPIFNYTDDRNFLALDGTSTLSPYLRFGMLSARQAVLAALDARAKASETTARQGAETWLNELIWREFYLAILYHFPFVLRQAFNPALRNIAWRTAPDELRAWQQGQTGYPIVDASMRQLNTTGWMHNRGRMIVASFLTKDLLLDWRLGEAWFMQQLVDGDPAANNGGWQWTAGVGTDAAPYFRIFNPVLQSEKFDPDGMFIRRYVPELARVPNDYIHTPWKMTPLEQHQYGCVIGRDYPAPIVDRAVVRDRTLSAYKQAQNAYRG